MDAIDLWQGNWTTSVTLTAPISGAVEAVIGIAAAGPYWRFMYVNDISDPGDPYEAGVVGYPVNAAIALTAGIDWAPF